MLFSNFCNTLKGIYSSSLQLGIPSLPRPAGNLVVRWWRRLCGWFWNVAHAPQLYLPNKDTFLAVHGHSCL